MSFEDFQDGRHGRHLGYRYGIILAILNLHVVPMPPTKFGLNPTFFRGEEAGRGSLRPFQEYFTYIEPIVHQRWAKTGEPGKKHLTIRKQNLAFPHVTRARLEPQRWETEWIKSLLPYPLGYGSCSLRLPAWEEVSFVEFQDGRRLGYQNGSYQKNGFSKYGILNLLAQKEHGPVR